MRKKRNYINNADLMEHFREFKKQINYAKENGLEKPAIPKYIGEAIFAIATKLNSKGNFYSYSYKDEMISDGIENCVKYVDRFDPEKYNNPFAYITTICYNASIRRIQLEKKQTYIKSQIVKNSGIIDNIAINLLDNDENNEDNTYLKFLYELDDIPSGFYKEKKKKKSISSEEPVIETPLPVLLEKEEVFEKEVARDFYDFDDEQEYFETVKLEDYLFDE